MKLIAHRGASLERQENTAESLNLASRLGAWAVECDVRITSDGEFVMYHDGDMRRLAHDDRKIEETSLADIRAAHEKAGLTVYTFDEITSAYTGKAFILLDLCAYVLEEHGDRFLDAVRKAGESRFICGTPTVASVRKARELFPSERILSFNQTMNCYKEMYEAGAGNIRLWEHWLGNITPDDVRRNCPGAEVWIMSNRPGTGMNGTDESLDNLMRLGADAVLLNNIRMGADFLRIR